MQMILAWLIAVGAALAPAHDLSPEDRTAFRKAVQDYQIFVVPHCSPEDVALYLKARGDRDRAFIASLRNTPLMMDYEHAVAEQAERDRHTVYECGEPPPPPGGTPPSEADLRARHERLLAGHFASGDRIFAELVQLRDRLLSPPR